MGENGLFRVIETGIIGFLGGYIYSLVNLPLPWVLGALTAVILWQGFTERKSYWPSPIKNGGLIILGIYFGLYFSIDTFVTIGPYFLPYLLATFSLIFASVLVSMTVTKWIAVDKMTSAFGSIPGGLTEMVIASEGVKANSSLVLIFQTVRLLTVLFIVPSTIIFFFHGQGQTKYELVTASGFQFGGLSYLWFLIPIVMGIWLRNKIPAGVVIVPLAFTALVNISIVSLATLPPILLIIAQVAVGIGLGINISFRDLKVGGKYCLIYFVVSLIIIGISFGLGTILSLVTKLDLVTAVLSIAPGGLIEMVLTASIVGGDPAVVSALQLTRILVIVLFVPPFLTWLFKKQESQKAA